MILVGGLRARGDHLQLVPQFAPRRCAGPEQHGAGVDRRAVEQSVQRVIGQGNHVGRLGQLEGHPAELGRRPAHLGDGQFALAREFRLQEAALIAAVRDLRRLGAVNQDALVVFRGELGRGELILQRARRAQHRARIGKRLREVIDKSQVRAADADDVARRQHTVLGDPLAIDHRPVAAIQVAQGPGAAGHEHLGVDPAAPLVLDADHVGRRPADGDALPLDQAEDVGPLRPFSDYQVRREAHRGDRQRVIEIAAKRGCCEMQHSAYPPG